VHRQRSELLAGHREPDRIAAGVQLGFDSQAGAGAGRGDRGNDYLIDEPRVFRIACW
jgi:hypothetical protein